MPAFETMRRLSRLREGKIERALRDCVLARDALRHCLDLETAAWSRLEAARQAGVHSRTQWRAGILGQQQFSTDEQGDHERALARLDLATVRARGIFDDCVAAREQAQHVLASARAALASRRKELEQARQALTRIEQQRRLAAQEREESEQDEAALLGRRGHAMAFVA